MAEQPTLHQPTRTETVGRTGIYPASGPLPHAPAPLRGQGALAHPEERQSSWNDARRHGVALALGRALFGGYFVYSGINHFAKRGMLEQWAASKGVANPAAAVLGSGALLIAGGLSLITGTRPKVGAALIASFLVGVTPKMHDFWAASDDTSRMHDLVNFTKNIALIGGAALAAAVPEPWPGSLRVRAGMQTQALVPVAL